MDVPVEQERALIPKAIRAQFFRLRIHFHWDLEEREAGEFSLLLGIKEPSDTFSMSPADDPHSALIVERFKDPKKFAGTLEYRSRSMAPFPKREWAEVATILDFVRRNARNIDLVTWEQVTKVPATDLPPELRAGFAPVMGERRVKVSGIEFEVTDRKDAKETMRINWTADGLLVTRCVDGGPMSGLDEIFAKGKDLLGPSPLLGKG